VGYRGSAWGCTRSVHEREERCHQANVVHLAATICFATSILGYGFSDAAPDEIAMPEDEIATPALKVFPRARLCTGA
jgi:hypothetical protein